MITVIVIALALCAVVLFYMAVRSRRKQAVQSLRPVDLTAFHTLLDREDELFIKEKLPRSKFVSLKRHRIRVTMRYVGRLADGAVFSTSPDEGKGVSTFGVKEVIPGMSAALQLMRPGDRWRVTMPPYLAYGPGRPLSAASSSQTVQKQGIPPNATLVFDVELVSIVTAKAP